MSTSILQTNLTSDIPGMAQVTDPNLVNPWGLTPNPTGPFWVADNGTGLATLYDGTGQPNSLVVTIPPPQGGEPPAAPTGIVHNTTSDFVVQGNGAQGAAVFIFATEDGTISGWSPAVDPNNAVLTVDNSASEAVYKGLALGSTSHGNFLYATNFRAGTVDVFDGSFAPAHLAGSFTDRHIPHDYAPFGIQNLNGNLYVTFAKQNAEKHDDVPGIGHGFIDVFNTDGQLLHRLVTRGVLDSPWGLVQAPDHFGKFSGDLLVGNFGNGKIHAYNPDTGAFKGTLRDANHMPIQIDGLWGLSFGNGVTTDANTLFFTAGINDENDGLFGSLQAVTTDAALSDAGRVAQSNPGTAGTLVSQPASASVGYVNPIAGGVVDGTTVGGSSVAGNLGDSAPLTQRVGALTAPIDNLFAQDFSTLG